MKVEFDIRSVCNSVEEVFVSSVIEGLERLILPRKNESSLRGEVSMSSEVSETKDEFRLTLLPVEVSALTALATGSESRAVSTPLKLL